MAITIQLPRQSEDALFDGTSVQDRATIDIDASIARYHEVWQARVQETYPDADIVVANRKAPLFHISAPASDPDGHNDGDSTNDEQYIQQLGEELFNDGNAWMVEAE